MKILSTALAPPICGTDVSPQIINKAIKEFLPILIEKIQRISSKDLDHQKHPSKKPFSILRKGGWLGYKKVKKESFLKNFFEIEILSFHNFSLEEFSKSYFPSKVLQRNKLEKTTSTIKI